MLYNLSFIGIKNKIPLTLLYLKLRLTTFYVMLVYQRRFIVIE